MIQQVDQGVNKFIILLYPAAKMDICKIVSRETIEFFLT